MKLDTFKHLELCPDCQTKVNQAYFRVVPDLGSYSIKLRKNLYFIEYYIDGNRVRSTLRTNNHQVAKERAVLVWDDVCERKPLRKFSLDR